MRTLIGFRVFGTVCLLSVVAALGAQAAAVFTPDPTQPSGVEPLTLSRLISGGGEMDDVRGVVLLDVSNGGPLGTIALADTTLGVVPPDFTTLPFGNPLLVSSNNAQTISLTFDFAGDTVGPTTVTVDALGAPVSPVPTTDPALSAANGKLQFLFTLTSFTPSTNGPGGLAQYALTSVSPVSGVPEPASISLMAVALGLAAVGSVRRRMFRAARQ